ncbi:hypothetical protein DFH08DRAFT_813556 [Mycena albidolilacea]|uniref:NAD(P)-binding domain-containing protein n=1 Tax=Mycena albidolilacea TaxID=1033008 RepID=A0AAD7EMJ8_9AGAR|nr:hypothetical protein DFH08DRAFT_813556 [Mycena albidolilacea]
MICFTDDTLFSPESLNLKSMGSNLNDENIPISHDMNLVGHLGHVDSELLDAIGTIHSLCLPPFTRSSNILILGATDVSGLAFISVALSFPRPPAHTLYVRSRAKLPAGIEKQPRVVEGSLTDQDALLNAMEGVDTVMSFLVFSPTYIFVMAHLLAQRIGDAFPGILSAMRAKGVKRIFVLSTLSFSSDWRCSPSGVGIRPHTKGFSASRECGDGCDTRSCGRCTVQTISTGPSSASPISLRRRQVY